MKKGPFIQRLLGLFFLCTASVWAAEDTGHTQTKDFQTQAVEIAMHQFEKFGKKITAIPMQCLSFQEPDEIESPFLVVVREKHTKDCGGDPITAPRITTLKIYTTGHSNVLAQVTVSGEFKPLK